MGNYKILISVLVFSITNISLATKIVLKQEESALDWWQQTVFYQIYPRSFKDSDGNGVGDLKGITSKLSHLADSGIYATWLSPIFESPMVDFGYDISNFTKIDPLFGTIEDFEELLVEATRLHIKIILDFVPNHTSNKCEWFLKSENREPGFEDFYVWRDSKVEGEQVEPNNWVSVFSGSAWTWSDKRQQFYLHQFTKEQPDLNYNDEFVVQEMLKVLEYWADKGVSGFRIDAINHLFEDPEFQDEPLTGTDPTIYDDLDHIYTRDLVKSYEMLYSWREFLDNWANTNQRETVLLMTEAYAELEKTMLWYENVDGSKKGAHIPFNFLLIMDLKYISKPLDFKNQIDNVIKHVPSGHKPNWVIGNHDRERVGSRFNESKIDMMNTLVLTLPGYGVTYYGEEIGMVDKRDISWDDTKDPQACLTNPNDFSELSRDPVRTPFQWDNTLNAGFSTTTDKTWLPVHENYLVNNLQMQIEATKSHYKVYQALVAFRRLPTMQQSVEFKSGVLNDNRVFAYKRTLKDHPTYVIVLNFSDDDERINLSDLDNEFQYGTGTIIVSGIQSRYTKEDNITVTDFTMDSHDALVIKYNSARLVNLSLLLMISAIIFNIIKM